MLSSPNASIRIRIHRHSTSMSIRTFKSEEMKVFEIVERFCDYPAMFVKANVD